MKRDIDQLEAEEAASGSPPAKKHHGSADSAGDATLNRNKDVFSFFDLARGLRDLIYDEMLERKSTKIDAGANLDAFAVNLQPRHTQVCRQFHREAMERAQEVRELKLVDIPGYDFDAPVFTHLGDQIRTLHLCLAAQDDELETHQLWLESFLKSLPIVTEIRIRFNTHSVDGHRILKELSTSIFWPNIGSLRELTVYGNCSYVDNELIDESAGDVFFDFSGRYHIVSGS